MVHQTAPRKRGAEVWPVGQAVKTPASHAGNGGSIPPRVTKRMKARKSFRYIAAVESRGTRTGANDDEVPPVPIPNTEVKLVRAEDTWRETAWENRSVPVQEMWMILRRIVHMFIPP